MIKVLNGNKRYKGLLFLSLFALLVLINLPLFFNIVIPQHDTLFIYKNFYFVYNEIFFNYDIPDWLPFGFYGVQSEFVLLSISPSMYFSMFIGVLFGVENANFLFNLSLFLEQFILLFGSYLLALKLFKNRATVFIVCLTIICSTTLFYQIFLDFRPYIYLPLIIFFLIRFFDTFSPIDLAVAMLIFVLTFFGLPIYYAPVSFLIVLIIFLTLFAPRCKELGKIARRPGREYLYAGLLFALLIIVLALYNYYISNAMNFTDGLSYGRDPITRATYLDVFLNFPERYNGLSKFSALIIPSSMHLVSDLALHVGLLTLAFALYAIIAVRKTVLYAFALATLVLVLFSLGSMTPVAKVLYYYFPMMKYFRHIGMVVTSLKLFVPLMAGFGIDRLIDKVKIQDGEAAGAFRSGGLEKIIKLTLSILVILTGLNYSRVLISNNSNLYLTLAVSMVLLIFLAHGYRKKNVSLLLLLVSFFIFQALSYQALVINNFSIVSRVNKGLKDSSKYVNRYAFQSERTNSAPTKHAREGLNLTHRKLYPLSNKPSVAYTFDYNFLQWDPCLSDFRTDFLNSHVADLFRAEIGGEIMLMAGERLILPIDPERSSFYRTIGCLTPKLRLYKNVQFESTLKEEQERIACRKKSNKKDDDYLLISDPDKSKRVSWREAMTLDTGEAKGNIRVTSFSANELKIEVSVENDSGLWLYYADAWHPGWKASVNGEDVTVHRANVAFKALRISKGKSVVRFYFDNSASSTIGRVLILFELLSIIVLLAAVALRGVKRRRVA